MHTMYMYNVCTHACTKNNTSDLEYTYMYNFHFQTLQLHCMYMYRVLSLCIHYMYAHTHTHTHTHSPYQDDFLVLHVREEYDSVLETVLKTEFLTLLSEKYQAITQSKLSFTFNRR